MNINSVSTAHKVAEFILNTGRGKAPLRMVWDIDMEERKDTSGRVYILVVDGVIKKIGGSSDSGGINRTLGTYANGTSGRPSVRTYGICRLIEQALNYGSVVEAYMIPSSKVMTPVTGLFDSEERLVAPFKEMEQK